MEVFTDTVSISEPRKLKEIHDNINQADEELIAECIKTLSESMRDMIDIDSVSVHTIERKKDSPHDHVNQKEVASGDATVRFTDSTNNKVREEDIEYGIFAGKRGGIEGFIYDPIEVEVKKT